LSKMNEIQSLNNLKGISDEKRQLLQDLIEQLKGVAGIAAIVLGGSYASGTQHSGSDLDIGLYYFEANPFSIPAIRKIADKVSVNGTATVTGFYEWGAWVNGGAWIQTQQGKVDFLYRNVDHVARTIKEAQEGIVHHDYDQQPAYGFYSVIYLAETQICLPLYDPSGLMSQLKQEVTDYPPKLKQAIIAGSLWAAEFSLLHARGFAKQGDVYNTVGCLTRVASNMTQALFALNERYFIRDKQVMNTLATFSEIPSSYAERISGILACPGETASSLMEAVRKLEQEWQRVVKLPDVQYQPKFQV